MSDNRINTTLPLRAGLLPPAFDADSEKTRIMSQFDQADIDAIDLMGARVLVAKWIREKAGSIHLATQTKREDGFQGKIGLVLKTGPLAFTDDARHDWHGQSAQPGDWVLYGYSDGHDFDYTAPGKFDRVPCKVLEEGHIQAVLPRPDFAY
jgi:hypothetical protein